MYIQIFVTVALLPENEFSRLSALENLGLLYTPAKERFDRITRMACRLFDAPISLVSLIAEKCQWFKSRQGLDTSETPRNISFWAHAILREEPLVVSDTLLDDRFADNPLITGEPFIRFYAGAAIADESGNKLGTLCIIDNSPRNLSDSDIELLKDLAAWA